MDTCCKILKCFLVICISAGLAACVVTPGVYHTVKKGQNIYRISKAYGVEEEKLMKVNRLKDPAQIKVGQKIFIPGAMKELYVEPAPAEGESAAPTLVEGEKKEGQGASFIWPVKGKILSEFGARGTRLHEGIDISVPEGTPIAAAASGKVIYSSNKLRGYGNIIVIRHEGKFSTIYAHNRLNLVKEGEFVEQGQIIGKVGLSGRTSGSHLHFEVRVGENPVDPLDYLK